MAKMSGTTTNTSLPIKEASTPVPFGCDKTSGSPNLKGPRRKHFRCFYGPKHAFFGPTGITVGITVPPDPRSNPMFLTLFVFVLVFFS